MKDARADGLFCYWSCYSGFLGWVGVDLRIRSICARKRSFINKDNNNWIANV